MSDEPETKRIGRPPGPRCPCGQKRLSECAGCVEKHPVTKHWNERPGPVTRNPLLDDGEDWTEDED